MAECFVKLVLSGVEGEGGNEQSNGGADAGGRGAHCAGVVL